MSGNVSEWTWDWLALSGNVTDPTGLTGSARVKRGGDWNCIAGALRVAFRSGPARKPGSGQGFVLRGRCSKGLVGQVQIKQECVYILPRELKCFILTNHDIVTSIYYGVFGHIACGIVCTQEDTGSPMRVYSVRDDLSHHQ